MKKKNTKTLVERQRAAAKHGRRIKVERELNAIGLSLLAPPFSQIDGRRE